MWSEALGCYVTPGDVGHGGAGKGADEEKVKEGAGVGVNEGAGEGGEADRASKRLKVG